MNNSTGKFATMLAVLALSACGGGTAPTTTGPPGGPPTPADNAAFGTLLNNVRMANGAADVTFDARLAAASQAHATDMVTNGYLNHTGLNGSTVVDRVQAQGYNPTLVGENIAQGQQSEAQAMQSWTISPTHHAANIDPRFEDFGLAKAGTGAQTTWVLVLGAE